MPKATWSIVVSVLLAGALAVVLSSERGSAQPPSTSASARAELQRIGQLSPLFSERVRVADLAVTLLRPDAPDSLRHERHAELTAPPFSPGPLRFVPSASSAPRRRSACTTDVTFSHGAFPAVIPQNLGYADPSGCEGSFLPDGAVTASTHPFFAALGTNGRSCATCHQPPSGMSVSQANIEDRLKQTSGTDPIFAGVDGANCPNNLPSFTGTGTAFKAAHSLLLKRGLFRIFETPPAGAQFTITAAGHDSYGCNTTAPFNQDTVAGQAVQMVSVYRRPRISANLAFVTSFIPPPGVSTRAAIMWDTREDTLAHQVVDATHGHAQAPVAPTAAQVAAMVQFETRIYAAQARDRHALALNSGGAKGGPVVLAAITPSTTPAATPAITFDEYDAWSGLSGGAAAARRASIARGQKLFDTKSFTISNVAGLNDAPGIPSPFTGTCSGCHSQAHAGNEELGVAGALDIGTAGDSAAHNGPAPSADLPIFTITCTGGASTPFNGKTVVTNDPGVALFTGKCSDIGKFAAPQLRALAARGPYFHDGSAKTLWDVVAFYNKRFSIGLTYRQKQDLVNFLATL